MLPKKLVKIILNINSLKLTINQFISVVENDYLITFSTILKAISRAEDIHLRNILKSLSYTSNLENKNIQDFNLNHEETKFSLSYNDFEENLKQHIQIGKKLMKNTIKEAKKAENYVVELALSFVIKSYSQYIELYKNFQKEKIQNKKIYYDYR
jgi:hypothetical protein